MHLSNYQCLQLIEHFSRQSKFHIRQDDKAAFILAIEFIEANFSNLLKLPELIDALGKKDKSFDLEINALNNFLEATLSQEKNQLQFSLSKANDARAMVLREAKGKAKGKGNVREAKKLGRITETAKNASAETDAAFLNIHSYVQKQFNDFYVRKPLVVFPGSLRADIQASDCQWFFSSIQNKLLQTKITLKTLKVSPLSMTVLDGLIDFSANPGLIRFDEVVLNVDTIQAGEKEVYIEKLKKLLSHFSTKDLKTLRFEDKQGHLTEEIWEALVTYIEKNETITVECRLPEALKKSPLQRRIDEAVALARYKQQLTPSVVNEEEVVVMPRRQPRSRKGIGKLTDYLAIDIQAEQQQQVEFNVEVERIEVQEIDITQTRTSAKEDPFFYNETLKKVEVGFLDKTRKNDKLERWVVSDFEIDKVWCALFGHILFIAIEDQDPTQAQDISRYDLKPVASKKGDFQRNSFLGGVGRSALQQIMHHHKQFESGIDLNHLPAGFRVVPYTQGQNIIQILDYDKIFESEFDPLAIQLLTPLQARPLSPLLVKAMWPLLEKGSPRDQLILNAWQMLVDKEYDSDSVKLFQQHLPKLFHFNAAQLQELFDMTFDGHQMNQDKFDFMIKTIPEFKRLYPNGYRKEDPYARSIIRIPELYFQKHFANEAAYQDFVNFAHSYSPPQAVSPDHCLFRLLADDKPLTEAIERWSQALHMTDNNLDALLDVYSQQGKSGLLALFSSWQQYWDDAEKREQMLSLHTHLFSQAQSYLPLLNKSYQAAMEKVYALRDPQKQWWDRLLAQHGKTVGYDDLPALVNAFTEFSRIIDDKNLSFYPLREDSFKDAKNMPTILARMLTLLDHCEEKDRPEQWAGISQVALHSNGAILAVQEAALRDEVCGFVVPEMAIEAERHHSIDRYGATDVGIRFNEHNQPMHHNLAVICRHDRLQKADYYRSIAAYRERLPLAFYQQALALLEKEVDGKKRFEPKIEAWLAALLVGSTVGNKNKHFMGTEREMLADWESLLDALDAIEVPPMVKLIFSKQSIQKDFLKLLFRKSIARGLFSSPLPILKQYITFQTTWLDGLKKASIFSAGKAIEEFQKVRSTMINIQDAYGILGDHIYEGFRFYNTAQPDTEVFIQYVNTVKQLCERNIFNLDTTYYYLRYTERDLEMYGGLARLISTFHLGEGESAKEDMAKLLGFAKAFLEHEAFEEMAYMFQLLAQMDKNEWNGKALSAQDLIHFIEALKNDSWDLFVKGYPLSKEKRAKTNRPLVEDRVKQAFSDYYADGFFEGLRAGSFSKATLKQIEVQLPNERSDRAFVNDILEKLRLQGDEIACKAIIARLAAMLRHLKKEDKAEFKRQFQADVLYKEKAMPSAQQFTDLLDALLDRGHANDFSFFKAQMPEAKVNKVGNLVAKAIIYMSFLPQLSQNASSHISLLQSQKLIANLILGSSLNNLEKDKGALLAIIGTIDTLAAEKRIAKDLLISFLESFIHSKAIKDNDEALIQTSLACVETMASTFRQLESDAIRSLCYQYSGQEGDWSAENLIKLLNRSDLGANQANLLTVITVLLNNGKYFKENDLELLIKNLKDHAGKISACYQNPPFPSMEQLNEWLTLDPADFEEAYKKLDKEPSPRSKKNGFNVEDAKAKIKGFKGVKTLSAEQIQVFDNYVKDARSYSTADLITQLQAYKDQLVMTRSRMRLIALAAELLYRTKGKEGEINTTQYLAVFALLESEGHVTGEIATGEGKTRIMAIITACQFALGNTVDFLSSDMALAGRDYQSFQSYYQALGAETNLIYPDTPANQYKIAGINFSDPASISLFRNKARSSGDAELVIAADKTKRALCLDEGDKTFYDVADIRFNYSKESDESIKGMENWVYDLLIDFFAQDDLSTKAANFELFKNDIDGCNAALLDFAASKLGNARLMRLKGVSEKQLEVWLRSAVIARVLQYGKDFVIEGDSSVMTATGSKIVSQAYILSGHRISTQSKFAFGVHQCLHARLNHLARAGSVATKDEADLVEKLKDFHHPFNVDAEKQIIYSSSSKNLLDDYKEGRLIAVTGTAGSEIERQEARNLYGEMDFVNVPRHKGLKRIDKTVLLTANEQQQIKALIAAIEEARKDNQPVMIVCENDQKSKVFFKALKKAAVIAPIQRVHSQTKDEKKAVEDAGKPGMVTVTTPAMGRGVHIPLDKATKRHKGLKVLINYLPNPRDLDQMIGRSGRYGQQGDTQLILNKQELKQRLGKASLTDGFYTSTETYLKRQQALMDRKKQCHRLIKNTVSDFEKAYHDKFYSEARNETQQTLWSKFSTDKNRLWSEDIWSVIAEELAKPAPSLATIENLLSQFKMKTQAFWDDFCNDATLSEDCKVLAPPLELDAFTKNTIADFDVKTIVPHQVKIFDKYEPAHDGRAVVYSRPFVKLAATLRGERELFANIKAWNRGHGILFPNLRAWWNGELSLRQYLLGGRSDKTVIEEAKAEIPVSSEPLEQDHLSECGYGLEKTASSASIIGRGLGGPVAAKPAMADSIIIKATGERVDDPRQALSQDAEEKPPQKGLDHF